MEEEEVMSPKYISGYVINFEHILEEHEKTAKEELKDKNEMFEQEKNNIEEEKELKNNNPSSKEIIETEKYNLNILYYDENLKNIENDNISSFFQMYLNGTFYGCHNFILFKNVYTKIKSAKMKLY